MRISDWSSDVCSADLGSLVMSGIRQLPGVRAVAAMDKQYQLSLRAAQIGMRQAESRGEMGSAAFNSVMNFKSLGVQFNTDLGAARKAVTRSSALLGAGRAAGTELVMRSEEHTSELQSLMRISYAVLCWKKTKHK